MRKGALQFEKTEYSLLTFVLFRYAPLIMTLCPIEHCVMA